MSPWCLRELDPSQRLSSLERVSWGHKGLEKGQTKSRVAVGPAKSNSHWSCSGNSQCFWEANVCQGYMWIFPQARGFSLRVFCNEFSTLVKEFALVWLFISSMRAWKWKRWLNANWSGIKPILICPPLLCVSETGAQGSLDGLVVLGLPIHPSQQPLPVGSLVAESVLSMPR